MSACVVDADVLIAALDRSDANHGVAARAITRMVGHGTPLLLSVVNYAEVLVRPAQDPAALRKAVDSISAMRIDLVSPTTSIARDAARLRGGLGLSLPDGFAVATARARDATVATFDRHMRSCLRRADVRLAPGLPPGRPA
jgi:predicted nucleic acid-binding protein